MIRTTLIALLALTSAGATAQQVPDQAAARRLLFPARGAQVAIIRQPFLDEADIATLRELPGVAQLAYYGALAVDPAQGLRSETARGAFNFHSIEAARAAALSQCGAACRIVAEIRPRGYEAGRPLTLSQDATAAVAGRGLGRSGPGAALAASPSTGAWAVGAGAPAAIAACTARGATDCRVAVAN